MNTATYLPVYAGQVRHPSVVALIARTIVSALAESRARSAARELRRHDALMADLGRRQEHTADFWQQSDALPLKI